MIRYSRGSVQQRLNQETLKNIMIPLVDLSVQRRISQLIQQSFKARKISKKLLEIAKRTVEIYVEEDEEKGLQYAREQLDKMNIKID